MDSVQFSEHHFLHPFFHDGEFDPFCDDNNEDDSLDEGPKRCALGDVEPDSGE